MIEEDYNAFADLWVPMQVAYGKQPAPAIIRMDFNILSDFSLEQVRFALTEHRRTGSFAPQPADIVRIIKGDIEGQALKAAENVEWAVSRRGPYISPVFDDRRTQAVVCALGGWIKTVEMFDAASNPEFVKSKIAKLYKSLPADAPVFELIGKHDGNNGTGRTDENTVYIGDQTKAKALLCHIEQVKLLEGK